MSDFKKNQSKNIQSNQGDLNSIYLGKSSPYPDAYDSSLLQPIARNLSRQDLFGGLMPFDGVDIWTAYELSWLNKKGLPQVRIAEFHFPSNSKNIIESKSFKYYLNSLNQTQFSSPETLIQCLEKDLSVIAGAAVEIELFALNDDYRVCSAKGECVDGLDATIEHYTAKPELLQINRQSLKVKNKQLYSHLLKTNCPITDQPDWATIWIEYSGCEIIAESFLKYIVSLRQHQDYHESSVEQIFYDISHYCEPTELSVCARYTRRGGLDINPFRTNTGRSVPFGRGSRQ